MTAPVRLRLSRARAFDLQALSIATNGLRCVVVARPGFWGNPFTVTQHMRPGATVGGSRLHGYLAVPSVEDAIACFRAMMTLPADPGQRAHEMRAHLHELRGHNLACWCKMGAPCHADVLLQLASAGSTDGI